MADRDRDEQFWTSVLEFDGGTSVVPFQVLVDSGIELPAPDDLGDSRLSAKLWEVIDALAFLGVELEFTNHLSDRELYAELWNRILREEIGVVPEMTASIYHVDLIGTGSEADLDVYLAYYATEKERREWARDLGDRPLPEHKDLPFDRDRYLPCASRFRSSGPGHLH